MYVNYSEVITWYQVQHLHLFSPSQAELDIEDYPWKAMFILLNMQNKSKMFINSQQHLQRIIENVLYQHSTTLFTRQRPWTLCLKWHQELGFTIITKLKVSWNISIYNQTETKPNITSSYLWTSVILKSTKILDATQSFTSFPKVSN